MMSDICGNWPESLKDMAIENERLYWQVRCLENQAAACQDMGELDEILDQLIELKNIQANFAREYWLAKSQFNSSSLNMRPLL